MRIAVERLAVPHAGNPHGVVTVSAGLAVLDPGRTRSVSEMLKEADQALYRAKQLGRNRVEHPDLQPASRSPSNTVPGSPRKDPL
jgi:diguanylate cyclase (GGDEF)-like protein